MISQYFTSNSQPGGHNGSGDYDQTVFHRHNISLQPFNMLWLSSQVLSPSSFVFVFVCCQLFVFVFYLYLLVPLLGGGRIAAELGCLRNSWYSTEDHTHRYRRTKIQKYRRLHTPKYRNTEDHTQRYRSTKKTEIQKTTQYTHSNTEKQKTTHKVTEVPKYKNTEDYTHPITEIQKTTHT